MNESNALNIVGIELLVTKGVNKNNPVIRVSTMKNGMPWAKMDSISFNDPPRNAGARD